MSNKYFLFALIFISALALTINLLSDSKSEKLVKGILISHVDEIIVDENKTNFKELSEKMTGLKFKLHSTEDPQLDNLQMIGAKYFNINDHVGAQIKFRDTDQSVVTLYEFELEEDLDELKKVLEIGDKSFQVKFWREGGLYFLIVRRVPGIK